jgi:hypothetical protein
MPFIAIPGASTPAVSVTIPPGTCKYFFEELFAKQLKTPVASKVARRQLKQAFDRRTGRLLAPRRKGKLGVEKDVAAAEACFLGDSF